MKVALVHDWLTGMRGGEKCLEIFCELFPDATVYTLLYKKGSVSETISRMKIKTSFVQNLPFASNHYQKYLPLFPTAIEQFDLTDYDLVISSSHCVAKGVITSPESCHICYCHTPMRYAWEMYYTYFSKNSVSPLMRWSIPFFMNYLRSWDERSADRVDYFVANSQNVRRRIQKHYRRDAEVIYPPVDIEHFDLNTKEGEYYLVVSALVPYKRNDLAVLAFNELNLPLRIVGQGSEKKKVMKIARKNIKFIDWQPRSELKRYYEKCKALIFPGEEDFGIVPVEAQACGRPVLAFGKGGVTESVKGAYPDQEITSSHTGIFFYPQTKDALIEAVRRFESGRFDPHRIRENALRFDKKVFKEKIKEFIQTKFEEHRKSLR
ncbi:MAG: glycosyl transferase [candidate division Zixibacteria bacterium SM23_73_3]|nr:MAG: glycosyl transferase [candidate division Zixibacteria bacterium SM23_73_3]